MSITTPRNSSAGSEAVEISGVVCPTCRQAGKVAETLTLKAMLAVPLTELRAGEYFFCPVASCPTVYFSADGSRCFDESQLRERVYQKHPGEPDALVCYCFRHTVESIQREPTEAVAAVTRGIQAGLCACDIRNPQGSCCLGNVRKESLR